MTTRAAAGNRAAPPNEKDHGMSDSHKRKTGHGAAGRHGTGKHVATHAANNTGAHGPGHRTLAIALPIAATLVMLGIALIGSLVQLPLLGKLGLEPWLAKLICLAVVYLGMSIFIRPMLDMKSPQFTTLWVKNRNFRLPLMALTAIRVLIIVIIAFIPANTVSGVAGLWLLPLILAAVLLIYRSGWFASAYLSVEARFLANFN